MKRWTLRLPDELYLEIHKLAYEETQQRGALVSMHSVAVELLWQGVGERKVSGVKRRVSGVKKRVRRGKKK